MRLKVEWELDGSTHETLWEYKILKTCKITLLL
jgi:hypothetical protein